jgi:hypothetical protein
MKKVIWIIVAILVLLILCKVFINWLSTAPCPPPEKPDNVPSSAVWKGGCDGGNWIELVSLKEDVVRFRIYRDWNGKLMLDADFNYQECSNFRLNENNWENCAGDFINGNIGIHVNCHSNIKCRLEPIYPAYYEETPVRLSD